MQKQAAPSSWLSRLYAEMMKTSQALVDYHFHRPWDDEPVPGDSKRRPPD